MTNSNQTDAIRIGCLLLCLILPTAALSKQWYIGSGITNLSLNTSNSSISFGAFNALTGSQSGGSDADVEAGSAIPTLTIGLVFGEKSQWLVESTVSLGFDETVFANGQKFATAKIIPLNLFGAYQGKRFALGGSSVSISPIIGAGIIYVYHADTEIVSPQFSTFPGADISLSSSLGAAALAGVNINLKKQTSLVVALTYLDGIQTDVAIENFELSIPFVTVPSTIEIGGVDLNGLAATARLQYLF